MNDEWFFERTADSPARIERIARVLVAILQAGRYCAALAPRQLTDLLTFEHNGPAAWCMNAGQRLAQCRLAATRFADDAKGLAAPHLKGHPVERPNRAHFHTEGVTHRKIARQGIDL